MKKIALVLVLWSLMSYQSDLETNRQLERIADSMESNGNAAAVDIN